MSPGRKQRYTMYCRDREIGSFAEIYLAGQPRPGAGIEDSIRIVLGLQLIEVV